jgi:hypothetical protein
MKIIETRSRLLLDQTENVTVMFRSTSTLLPTEFIRELRGLAQSKASGVYRTYHFSFCALSPPSMEQTYLILKKVPR